MNPAAVAVGCLIGLGVGILADLVSEEVRGRLDRLPHRLIRLAGRRLDPEIREDVVGEWIAELQTILDIHRATLLPITRLIIGTRYALGLLRAGAAINRDLSPSRRQRGSTWHVAMSVGVALTRDLVTFARAGGGRGGGMILGMATGSVYAGATIGGLGGAVLAIGITVAASDIIAATIGWMARRRNRRRADRGTAATHPSAQERTGDAP